MAEPKPFTDGEITNFQQLVDQVEKDMPPMLLIKPGYVEAHKNYVHFLATIADLKAKRTAKEELFKGYIDDWGEKLRKANERIEKLGNREKSILKTANAEVKKSIDQAATIERLRGENEELQSCIDTDPQGIPITINWEKARALYIKIKAIGKEK